ncbi:RNA 3'-phosphate cyclase [Desulfohalobiaceae bacterium Ax17]|uniref:RNA 3'-terminal phosphate cyclase n=1 Tax=Desulfovulcanus ferrireducens TaxID=2831190 RepID=UPI00207BBA05|nr:RNA 3'-terminal phosphate cyclase [Desulfovulcanus ferrireducens]MBT8762340.1 RNA 3'-phosphate cyclase [Desulfovulcanus ferrireducens]
MVKTLRIDGSRGEGGGQILRTSLALAALLRQPVEIYNIRANRRKPGLRPQHLVAVQALTAITGGELRDAHENSTRLYFAPQTIKGGNYRFKIRTAGSTGLVLAAVLLPLLFASTPSEVNITGGTHVPFSPPFHYLESVFLPALKKMEGHVELSLLRWGWYPKGCGEITAKIDPCACLHPVELRRRGRLLGLHLTVGLTELPMHIAERAATHVAERLSGEDCKVETRIVTAQSTGPGVIVFLYAIFERTIAGFSALGRRGKPVEQVADEVCQDWFDFKSSPATVDSHLADQLIPYMALAKGNSCIITEKFTSHLETNIRVVEQFLPVHFHLDSNTGEVSVQGIGHGQQITLIAT